jgi:hypothetical protein
MPQCLISGGCCAAWVRLPRSAARSHGARLSTRAVGKPEERLGSSSLGTCVTLHGSGGLYS